MDTCARRRGYEYIAPAPAVRSSVFKPESMPTHRDDIAELVIALLNALAQAAHKGIDRLLTNPFTAGFGPDCLDDLLARQHAAARIPQCFQQAILVQAERRIDQDTIGP